MINFVVMSRKKHSSGLKTKIVLEALQERISIQELGKKYDIHPNQISTWKTQFLKGAIGIFEKGVKVTDDSKEKEDLFKKIGQLQIENDFLKKVLGK
jgi:transposase